MELRPMQTANWAQVQVVYAEGIATGHATFETEPPSWDEFDVSRLPAHRWVAVEADRIIGWAAAVPVSDRCAYAGVAEHSVYVASDCGGRGIGRALLVALIESTEQDGIWTLQSGIFPENVASLRLHRALGFHEVGVRRRLGRMTYGPMAGAWRDVVLVERRSEIAGQ